MGVGPQECQTRRAEDAQERTHGRANRSGLCGGSRAERRWGTVCRSLGISEATYYVWKKQYADLGVTELRELRQLREENERLKRLVADLSLDRQILQDCVKKAVRSRLPLPEPNHAVPIRIPTSLSDFHIQSLAARVSGALFAHLWIADGLHWVRLLKVCGDVITKAEDVVAARVNAMVLAVIGPIARVAKPRKVLIQLRNHVQNVRALSRVWSAGPLI